MKKLFTKSVSNAFLVAAIVLVFFLPNLLRGKIPIPADALINLYHPLRDVGFANYLPGHFPAKNTLITDPILQTYPWKYLAVKNILNGAWPLWNPYSFSGQPLLANSQSSVFQITGFLFLVFPFNIAWALNIMLAPVLMAIFTYLFLSEIKIDSKKIPASGVVLASAMLPFTGFFVSWMEWGTIINTAMWLPLILLSINKFFQKISSKWFLILTFSVSQTIFSGHLQSALYVFLASFIYTLFHLLNSKKIKAASIISVAFTFGLLISSPQIISTLEFIKLSSRNVDQAYTAGRPDWFIPANQLIQLIAPDFFGNPTTGNYWGVWNYGEFLSFIGVTLGSFVLFYFLKFKKDLHSIFFATLMFLSLLLATKNPLSQIPYLLNLPTISTIQPSRIIFLLDFALVCISSTGFGFFLEEKNKLKKLMPPALLLLILLGSFLISITQTGLFPTVDALNVSVIASRNLILPMVFVCLLLLVSALKLKRQYLILLVFLITTAELFRFAYKFLPFSSINLVFPQTKTIEFLQSQPKPFRIISTDRRILHPNIPGAYQIESVDGYDPLYLSTYSDFVSAWQSEDGSIHPGSFNRIVTPQKINSNFINLLNVKYVATFDDLTYPNLTQIFTEGETKIYQNTSVLPRAFFVSEVKKITDKNEELKELSKNNFDLSQMATSRDLSFSKGKKGEVNITGYSDQSITMNTKTENPAPLIISNVNYPGWRAYIDGTEEKIQNADSIFQLLIIPAGNHTVKLSFYPKSFEDSIKLMLLGLIGSIGLAAFIWRQKFQ